MPTPPTDNDGFITPHDDHQTIPNDSYVIRYIHRKQLPENKDGTRCLSSGAFSGSSEDKDRYEGMSVDMEDELRTKGVTPDKRMPDDHEAAVLLPAGELRKLGLRVGPGPMLAKDPFHASVWDVKRTHRKKIKALSEWLIKPSDVT